MAALFTVHKIGPTINTLEELAANPRFRLTIVPNSLWTDQIMARPFFCLFKFNVSNNCYKIECNKRNLQNSWRFFTSGSDAIDSEQSTVHEQCAAQKLRQITGRLHLINSIEYIF